MYEFLVENKRLFLLVIVLVAVEVLILYYGGFSKPTLEEGALYHGSKILVGSKGSLDIRETITVKANRKRIRHGIARALPKKVRDPSGEEYEMKYQVIDVKRDGKTIKYQTREEEWGTRVELWEEQKKPLTIGEHTFQVHYRVSGLLREVSVGHEVRRNLTGKWIYPIMKTEAEIAVASVIDPDSIRLRAYIYRDVKREGMVGQILEKEIELERIAPHRFHFETKRPLIPGEEVRFDLLFQSPAEKSTTQ